MKIESIVICKDILIGHDSLITAKDVFFNLTVPQVPCSSQVCFLFSLRAESGEIGSVYPLTIRMLTPDKSMFVLLYNDSLQIREEVTLLYLKGTLSFIQEGKQIINIMSNATLLHENPVLSIIRVDNAAIPSIGSLLATSASTCQR